MCRRFQTGSNRPLAKRKARMLSTDSLPRKWSMRNTCDSSKTSCTARFRARAERLLDDHPRALGQAGRAEEANDRGERGRRYGQVIKTPNGPGDFLLRP